MWGVRAVDNAEIERLVMKPTARRRLGKYVVLGRVGAGGMGKIYLAYAPGPAGIEKVLIIKRLHGHLTGDRVLVNSFLDEARLSMALNHPNIVHTYDVGELDGRYFMVMEYIEGQNLGVVLRQAKRSGQYPPSTIWGGMFLSVLDGLHAAHVARDARGRSLEIIHRDISPQNILLTYDGLPKLVDFGIAKAAMRISETDAGVLKGKYAYMSPEQVRGEPLDARSDVFAAGVVLWEALAGRRLYKADSMVRSVERILKEPALSPARVNPECSPELGSVAVKALQKDRALRFSSALEMRNALDDALQQLGARVRQADTRDLMHAVFGDVIVRQRSVLEACLADEEAAAARDGEAPELRQDAEAELSLLMQRGAEGSGSKDKSRPHSGALRTPDAHGVGADVVPAPEDDFDVAAPLPADGDRDGDGESDEGADVLRATSVARRRRPGTPEPFSRQSTLTAPEPMRLRPPRGSTPATGVSARELIHTEPTPLPAQAPGRQRASWIGVAALAGATFVVVGTVGLGIRSSLRTSSGTAPSLNAAQPDVAATSASGIPAAHGETQPPTTELEPSETPTPPTPPAQVTKDTDTVAGAPLGAPAPQGASVPQPETAAAHPATEAQRRHHPASEMKPAAGALSSPPSNAATSTATSSSTSTATSAPEPGSAAPEANRDRKPAVTAELATLTLDTVPWTVVYLGTRKLGETPLVRVAIPAGTQELILENPDQKLRETYVVTTKPGQDYKARLDLQ